VKNGNPLVLGIDVGTTAAKAAIVDLIGNVVAFSVSDIETIMTPDQGAEQDPDKLWDTVRSIIQQCVGLCEADRIVGISCTSQYASVIPVDHSCSPTHNMITWMDRRGAPYNLEVYGTHEEALPYWMDVHGLPPSPTGGVSLAHMQWLKHERPEAYARTHAFLEPSDFITSKLTGRIVSNPCTVFPLLVTDNRHPDDISYDDRLIEMSGLDRDKLPELTDKTATIGNLLPELAVEFGIPEGIPVLAPVNDTQANTIATGATQDNVGGLSIGTTSVLVTSIRTKKSDLATAMLTMPSPLPGEFNVMAENGMGGKVIEHALERWFTADDALADHRVDEPYIALNDAVRTVPAGSNGVLFLPWLGGSLAPNAKDYMRAGFVNLGIHNSRLDLARAVLEGVAMNIRWLLDAVETFTGTPISSITMGGGGARMDSMCQIMADVLSRPVKKMKAPHAIASCGVAMLTFERLGYISSADFGDCIQYAEEFLPNEQHQELYNSQFEHFLSFFEANQELYQRINQ
jgi:xylulokinase